MAKPLPWKTAWIIGASSGIGREIALALAKSGVRTVAAARSVDKLNAMAAGEPGIDPMALDIEDRQGVAEAFSARLAMAGPPDLVVLSAGIWQPMGARSFDIAAFERSVAVNVIGVANCLAALLPAMISRGEGHIAIIASIAGYRGLPNGAAYGATKAALINLAESLAPDLARFGVKLSIINPGFVATPMTEVNKFPMPFIVSADDAAGRIIRGLARGRYEIAFPWPLVAFLKLLRGAPNRLFLWYVRNFMLPRR